MEHTRTLKLAGLLNEGRSYKQDIAALRKKMAAAASPVDMAAVLFDSVKAGEINKNQFFDIVDSLGAKFE